MPRKYGSGSIRERRPGVWQLRAAAGTDPVTGRPRTITETFTGGSKDAQRRLAQLVALHGGQPSTDATLGYLLERWLATARIADSTAGNYRTALKHLPDRMYGVPLSKLGAHELDSLYRRLERDGVGTYTIRTLHAALSSALTQGVRWRWIGTNPARDASPPPPGKRDSTTPTALQVAQVLQAVDDPQLNLWLRLAVVTGARRSEVLALRWRDVDLEAGKVSIAGALDINGRRKDTKTGEARTLALDPATVSDLAAWYLKSKQRALAVGVRLPKASYVLSNEPDSSQPWRPDLATKRFRRIADRLGLDVRLHDLRHAHATELLSRGIDLATVSRRLGHSRTSTTLDVYSHVVAGSDERAAEVVGELFGG